MMTAVEARVQSHKNYEYGVKRDLEVVELLIKEKIERGQYQVQFNGRLLPASVELLRKLGYKVKSHDDGFDYTIRW